MLYFLPWKNGFWRFAGGEDQEELADVAREIESRRSGVYRLSDEERIAVRAGMDAARRGDFVPEDELDEFYRLHHRV